MRKTFCYYPSGPYSMRSFPQNCWLSSVISGSMVPPWRPQSKVPKEDSVLGIWVKSEHLAYIDNSWSHRGPWVLFTLRTLWDPCVISAAAVHGTKHNRRFALLQSNIRIGSIIQSRLRWLLYLMLPSVLKIVGASLWGSSLGTWRSFVQNWRFHRTIGKRMPLSWQEG